MASRAFDEFVRREQASARQAKQEKVDWQAEKARWLTQLKALFSQVSEYLQPYVKAGQIAVEFGNIELNEEYIGPYVAPVMVIRIGSKTIELKPAGTLLIGSRGRVDVIGPAARAQLVLLDSKIKSLSQMIHVSVGSAGKMPAPPPTKPPSEIDWAWRIVTRPPRRDVEEINQDSFLGLLVEIANG